MEKQYNTPIALIFFNRPEPLKQVFAWIKRMKPKQLFLIQDGPRAGKADDWEKIEKCREIVETVDWECQVYKNYAEHNLSCDEREFSGISWCFEYVDRLLILEDDCLPSNSFYEFCDELLEKYKDDRRIHMICGFNRMGSYTQTPYDYIFSRGGAGWGWATWKRVWKNVERIKGLEFLDEKATMEYYKKIIPAVIPLQHYNILERAESVKEKDEKIGRVSSWELLIGITRLLQGSVCIVPRINMIQYLGATRDATHSPSDMRLLPRKTQQMLMQEAQELQGAIKHPPFVIYDTLFEKKNSAYVGKRNVLEKIETLYRMIYCGRWDLVKKAIWKK